MPRIALALACLLGLVLHADAAEPKLKGLLITGGCCHDYEAQKKIITEGLSQRASIAWDVVHEGGDGKDHRISVYEKPGWTKGYDVIVHNECFGAIKDAEFIQNIVGAHQNGTPGIFVHCALHSYREAGPGADGWRELIGVTSVRHESKHGLDVKRVDVKHPILAGFPEEWRTEQGELYVIQKVWPNCTPLATAYGTDTKMDHPVIWANTFGRTRCYGISLGHHNETMNTDVWLDTTARGLLWVTGHLTDDGKPEAGYEGTGVQPIDISLKPVPE
jgi:uncharacterized protein